MAFQFPAAPVLNQVFTPLSGVSYRWNGVIWVQLMPQIGTMAVGNVIDFAGLISRIPQGYLNCDGSAISRAAYPELFLAISTTWGVGDGSTTFNLPNLSRRTTIGSGGAGSGTIGNAVGNLGGEETHLLTVAELAAHGHFSTTSFLEFSGIPQLGAAGSATIGGYATVVVGNTGGNVAHNTMQPSAVMLKIICATPQAAAGTVAPALTSLTNFLSADVPLNNVSLFFTGPQVAQGTSGTWLVTGQVTVVDITAAPAMLAKLWDGVTVIASGRIDLSAISVAGVIALSGVITAPAGNLRISVRDAATTGGSIRANLSGEGKDSTITAVRIG